MSKQTQLYWEGAEWARDMIGQSEGQQAEMVCENITKSLGESVRPPEFKRGAMALIKVARAEARKR